MSKRVITATEDTFLRWAAPRTTRELLSEGMGLNRNTVNGHILKHGIAGRRHSTQPLSAAAVRLAWRRYKREGTLPAEVWDFPAAEGQRWHHPWTSGEIEFLSEQWGRMPVPEIAAKLGRRPMRVRRYAMATLKLPLHGPAELARLLYAHRGLRLTPESVMAWCREDKIRCFRENRWVQVHRDDAEWLLEHYEYREPFPRHPGLLIEAELRLAA